MQTTQQKEKTRREAESFVTTMTVKGDSVKEFFNNLTSAFAERQRQRDFALMHCTFCGEPNGECTHGE